jgi:hypothetical protein
MDKIGTFEHLIGLPLDEAQQLLAQSAPGALPLNIVETAPPQAPQRAHGAKQQRPKAHKDGVATKPRPAKQFRRLRVLRCNVKKEEQGNLRLQLLVAREEVKPDSNEATSDTQLNL